jgi:hypothetical protein
MLHVSGLCLAGCRGNQVSNQKVNLKEQAAMATTMKECIDNCIECSRVCLETIQHCLNMGGKHSEPSHLNLLQNCALICQTSAQFMISGSELHKETCRACAEVCSSCADDCESIGAGDPIMQRCIDMCRRCSDSCREMSAPKKAA